MAVIFVTQYIINIQNIVTILVVVAVILGAFAWFRKYAARVS